jgi:isoleucyl-tRNA synthetase
MTVNPLEAFKPGDNSDENYHTFDLHRPYVDDIVLVSASGKMMLRETDLIDVWFDSGAMPFAQFHYPFENKETLDQYFPADFIAEGVDQTRGWFFTLHAIATMAFDTLSFKTVISNGLVLDKNGNKMSKRLGNAADPFETIEKYGPDATRWYMITNAQPWDNLKFDLEGIGEVQRKFFGTLYNTYNFFALYANIDGFSYKEPEVEPGQRPEIDRWILSELNSLIRAVDNFYDEYEPTKAGRAISDFVDAHLSNWYVRLSRRRFWKGDYTTDKISAYQTLYTCLEAIAILSAPIAPFFSDRLFMDLNGITGRNKAGSVHLADFSIADESMIDTALEERMQLAQRISSMVLSLRKQHRIRVRQPLSRIMVPVNGNEQKLQIDAVKNLILSEVNIKDIEYISGQGILVKKVKPNFKALGPRYGKLMKQIAIMMADFSQAQINTYENSGKLLLVIEGENVELIPGDADIITEDIPGWVVASEGSLTVALDVTISDELHHEGTARELVNRIQNIRKEKGFEVTDRISLEIEKNNGLNNALSNNYSYICSETLADSLNMVDEIEPSKRMLVDLTEDVQAAISVERLS